MANDYSASIAISTSESEAGIRKLDSAARDLDKTLQNLHKSLQNSQGDLDTVAKSMTELTRANAELIRSEQARAKATVIAAKADGVAIDNQSKRAKTTRENAIAEAKVAKLRQQTVTGGKSGEATIARRDAESAVRIANTQAVTQARVTTETFRTATAMANLEGATTRAGSAAEMAAARTQRLADGSRRAASGTLELNDSLSNSRYLLYDVGQTYTVLAAALQVIPVATAAVAIAYEKDFAQVIRTNDALKANNGFETLRTDLKELATEIPLTFAEFSNIATIGGQLGIAGDSVESFTESVARFGAASNVSLDEAATAFGRLQNSYDPMRKDADFFNKIGSAIAYVGVKSAATETEIIAVNNQISAAGAQFGFAADEIVGLSGALASVRIRPELARGAFQRIMLGLSRSADEGADSFDKFAKYTGLAGDSAIQLFKSNPSEFFYKYIGGIKGAIQETGSVSAVLDDIGAKNVFDKQFILGLSNGYKVFGDSLGYASTAFNEGTFLNESTQGVFDTMDAKIKRIGSSIKNLGDTLAKGSLGENSGLTKIADGLLAITGAADRFAQATPGFTAFLNIVLGLGSAIGILLAFKAAQAFVLAGLVGFQQVLGKGTLAAGLSAKGILQQVAVTTLMHKGVTQADAQALVLQAGAFKAMGMSASTAAAQVALASGANGKLAASTVAATTGVSRLKSGFASAGSGALAMVGGPIGIALGALALLAGAFITTGEEAANAGDAIARGLKNGAEAGQRAAAEALAKIKVSAIDPIAIGNLDRSIVEVAEDAGVSFEKLAVAASKGKDAGKAVNAVMDELARSKGFATFNDMLSDRAPHAGQLEWLRKKITEVGNNSAKTGKELDTVAKASGGVGDAAGEAVPGMDAITKAITEGGEEAETATQKLDKFLASIFGIVDASGATQAALQTLGESIGESTDFGPGSEGGRENIANFQEAIKAAALEQQMLIDTTNKSTQQASADYIAFVEGLVAQMASHGVDPTNVAALADQAKGYFQSALESGPKPTVAVAAKVDSSSAVQSAELAGTQVQEYLNREKPTIDLQANTLGAYAEIIPFAKSLSEITGIPYEVVVDALTGEANDKTRELLSLITSITNNTYTAPIGADTSAAVTNVRNFANYASQQLAAVQTAYNNVAASAPTFAKYAKGAFKGVTGVTNNAPKSIARPTPSTSSVSQVAPPVQVAATKGTTPDFNALSGGYQKVKDAAEKAGDAGKKAGEDMADGISDATRAADDYANRLKTGLTSAFEAQYGLQKATDDYHSALNAMAKKRDDELKQLDDLITSQKELNNARNEELINARKAGIEKDISMKYGEVDRAADYAQQEQEALDAAAAKQKDIEANNAQVISLKAGIGELNGYSQAAIENREAVRNLEQKMLDMVVAYAATGASVDQVRAYAQRLTAQFQVDVGQIWQNRVATNALTGEMQRYLDVVNRVPYHKPTTVTADVGGAINNLNALNGAADWATRPREIPVGLNVDAYNRKMASIQRQIVGGGMADDPSLTAFRPGTFQPVYHKGGQVQGFAGGGQIPGKAPSNLNVDNRFASVDGRGLIKVQSEEFIMQKRAVDFWGSDFMNSINAMKMPQFSGGGSMGGRSSGGSSNGAPVLVELTAENIAAILRLADRPVDLYAGVEKLASTVAEGNAILASKGVFN